MANLLPSEKHLFRGTEALLLQQTQVRAAPAYGKTALTSNSPPASLGGASLSWCIPSSLPPSLPTSPKRQMSKLKACTTAERAALSPAWRRCSNASSNTAWRGRRRDAGSVQGQVLDLMLEKCLFFHPAKQNTALAQLDQLGLELLVASSLLF